MRRVFRATTIAVAASGVFWVASAVAFTSDVRVTDDTTPGTYRYSGGDDPAYTDSVLQTCSVSRGRQNEPSVEADPRNASLLLAGSNDYCGVFQNGAPTGPIWLGYYRSADGGASWRDSLVPGYPGDTSPAAARAQIDTASAGDAVIAWDTHGNAYFGAEASGGLGQNTKGNGDVWVARYRNPAGEGGASAQDASLFAYSRTVVQGAASDAGKFNDKTAIEVDRTGGRCDGNVYFAYSRFTGSGSPAIYVLRSTDRGRTWTHPAKLSQTLKDVQFPDIAVTRDGAVTVTYRQFQSSRSRQTDAVVYNRSTDCGASFGTTRTLAGFVHYDAQDVSGAPAFAVTQPLADDVAFDREASGDRARDCGDDSAACRSGYTFFRQDSQVRSTADQGDPANTVEVVYNATRPGTETATGTTYGTVDPGTGSQSAVYFARIVDGAPSGAPVLVDDQARGHQFFPDVAADQGTVHVIWWDSRDDPAYSPALPNGDTAAGTSSGDAVLSVFGTTTRVGSSVFPATAARVSRRGTNGNFEQFAGRRVPFAGDYLWVTPTGPHSAYTVWTDWRDTVPGTDPRPFEAAESSGPAEGFDVLQCRTAADGYATDSCPAAGGLDQNIYGNDSP